MNHIPKKGLRKKPSFISRLFNAALNNRIEAAFLLLFLLLGSALLTGGLFWLRPIEPVAQQLPPPQVLLLGSALLTGGLFWLRPIEPVAQQLPPPQVVVEKQVLATWYAKGLKNPEALTCASTKYAKGTKLNVSYQGKSVRVTVTDYGPEGWTGKDIDLSLGAFRKLADPKVGVLSVTIREIK